MHFKGPERTINHLVTCSIATPALSGSNSSLSISVPLCCSSMKFKMRGELCEDLHSYKCCIIQLSYHRHINDKVFNSSALLELNHLCGFKKNPTELSDRLWWLKIYTLKHFCNQVNTGDSCSTPLEENIMAVNVIHSIK